ncbi:F-box domain, Leucine-rich repeat domain, L domain-like protein [Artemisia annua]|uniref:F-box domain, Leucine-rich repeat domain, L domain-like protein n=1 Tax=Artemisia annua TaxID=35608 RepID=A0A2U1KUQ3_ARTAN|nr:F-box domain, Leucine-rich repeat domain, L domain-like protein [Artemisia annua]
MGVLSKNWLATKIKTGEMEKYTEDKTDWTLDLHEFILHYILSRLNSPKELVRMSVLSKNWLAVTASFPVLDFNFHKFYDVMKSSSVYADKSKKAVREMYFKYVTYTTSRFCKQQNVRAHTFILVTTLEHPAEIDIINRCLGLILMRGVKVLVIDIVCLPSLRMYRLPNILLNASSLKCLKIYKSELPKPSSLMVDVVKFKSLKELELVCVPLNEEIIKRLTTSCPLLEILIVQNCYGFNRFSVYGHQNLQKVWIYFGGELERIDIEAPNMFYLFLMDLRNKGAPSMNLASCKKLITLAYFGNPSLTSNYLTNFLSNFPILENLLLDLPDKYNNKKLRLSSHSLKKFVLNSELELEEIDINAPNLHLFYYQGRSHNTLPSPRNLYLSSERMECHPTGAVNALWFQKLRQFLDKQTRFKNLNLRISAFWDLINKVEELKVVQSTPYELKQVVLEPRIIDEVQVYVAVVKAILWCCRPQYLTLKSNFPRTNFKGWSHIVKFTYEKLLQQEDEGITNIQIVLWSSSSKDEKCFSDLNSFLKVLPSDRQGKTITFIKEKGLLPTWHLVIIDKRTMEALLFDYYADVGLAKDPRRSRVAVKHGWSCFGCFK